MSTAEAHAAPPQDAIVVGSGCAGAWAAKELTEAGLRTLLLEAGPLRTADEVPDREASYRRFADADPQDWPDQPVQRRHGAFFARGPHLFVDDRQNPYAAPGPEPYVWIRGMQVGGRSLTWGGSALRLSPSELEAGEFDGADLSWPLPYAEVAPFYTRVEQAMGLRGTAEGLASLPDGCYEGEPPALTPAERDFQDCFAPEEVRPAPVRFIPPDRDADGWPRFTMQATALAAAERTGRLRLRPNAPVVEVTTEPETGLATGVTFVDTTLGRRCHERARVVFLCCGTIETTRLMLNSASARHPDGLGNSSGWLGRGLMDHPVMTSSGVLEGVPAADGHPWSARQCGLVVPPQPSRTPCDVRPFGLWVTLQRLAADGCAAGGIDAQGEMLPRWDNRVRLGDVRDRLGVPVPVIACDFGPHERRLYAAMRREVEHAAARAGMRIDAISGLLPPGQNAHEMGTARMGSDPRASVLDPHNRCWDCPNLYVTDGSCFPSGGWQNPTLTTMALSARAGAHAARLLEAK